MVRDERHDLARAVAPVLADLERQHPGVLRLDLAPEHPDVTAMVWEADGSGTGLWISDAWSDLTDAVLELADQVQQAAIEAVWARTGSGAWPVCPEHTGGPPLGPVRRAGGAWWWCSTCGREVAEIGQLDLGSGGRGV